MVLQPQLCVDVCVISQITKKKNNCKSDTCYSLKMQNKKSTRKSPATVICGVKAAQEADGGHPAAHVLLGLGHQVPGALLRLQVKDEAALQLLLGERQASVHLRRAVRQGSFEGEG